MNRSRLLSVALAALLAIGLAWLERATPRVNHVGPLLEPDQAYAIDVAAGRASVDLDFSHGERYFLIISSLSQIDRAYPVSVSSRAISTVKLLPACACAPLACKRVACSNSPLKKEPSRGIDTTCRVGIAHRTSSRCGGQCPPYDYQQAARGVIDPISALPIQRSTPSPSTSARQQRRDFHIHITDGALEDAHSYVRVRSRLVAEGKQVRIYLDDHQDPTELHRGVTEELVRLFDEEILPVSRRTMGVHRDVDADGKFSILLTHWLGKLQGGRTSIGGFVRSSDFDTDVSPPFGNRADVLYLNSNVQVSPHLRSLLAHEYAHAVLFSRRLSTPERPHPLPAEEDWLNEAIAHLAENQHGTDWSNLDYRISKFLNAPASCPLVVADYYRAGRWRDHGCRGAAYLFLRWCVDQFGEPLLGKLMRGSASGTRNIQRTTDVSFDNLFRHWTISLLQSGRRSPTNSSSSDRRTCAEPLRFFDLRGRLGQRGLAGPRCACWDVATRSQEFELYGTATQFVEMRADGSRQPHRITVTAEPSAKLQLTLLKEGRDWPRLDIVAAWSMTSQTKTDQDASMPITNREMEIKILPTSTMPLEIELIACEPATGAGDEALCLAEEDLPEPARRFVNIATQRPLTIGLPVAHRRAAEPNCGWLVKLVASDQQGRRVSAWVTLPESKLVTAR